MSEEVSVLEAADEVESFPWETWSRKTGRAVRVLVKHARATANPGAEYQRGFADGYRAGVNESGETDGPESITAQLDHAIRTREATPGVPSDGPYPATVDEVADEVVTWIRTTEKSGTANALGHAVAARLARPKPAPVRVGDVIPGERARALGEGAVVILNANADTMATTRCADGWEPGAPGDEQREYLVLRPPFEDGASS